jgi:peptidyl-prolyl cis-trans isomerase C
MHKLTVFLAAGALGAMVSTTVLAQNTAVVNNRPIKKTLEDAWVKQLTEQGQKDSPELRARVKEELIRREVFMQEAQRRGLAEKADVKFQIENQRQSVLIQALMRDELSKTPLTDKQIAEEYEKQKAAAPAREFKARHILVKTEDEAKKVLERLKKGEKFEEVAKVSTDTGSAQKGGELDWAAPDAYVKPFSEALIKLEKGKMTEAPVQTQFGFHVIRLEDIRDTQFPPLDQVKGQLAEMMQQQRVQAFMEGLQKKAKITQ